MKSNYQAWMIQPLADLTVDKIELMKHLIGWGILAPNAHNVQPWKFIINLSKNRLSACIDLQRVLSASDKKGRQAAISLGCAVSHIVLAAKYYGLVYDLEISDDQNLKFYPEAMAEITFKGWQPKICGEFLPLLDAMKNRRVNRSLYNSQKEVPQKFQDDMLKIAQLYGTKLFLIRDMPTKIAISEIQFNADQFVMFNKGFRKELGECLLLNDTEQSIGMPGNTFGLSDEVTRKVVAELKKDNPTDPDILSGNAYASRECIRTSPLVCVIAGKNDTPYWWLKAGMTFGHLALEAEVNKLNTAVHAAMIEVGTLTTMLKVRLLTTLSPLVLFRLGYATEERPHSPRLNSENVTEIII